VDVVESVKACDVVIICVNTPPKNSSCSSFNSKKTDMTNFMRAVETIAKQGDPLNHKILVEKSTVPIGTSRKIRQVIEKFCTKPDDCFTIVSMPEFLAEGVAIQNLLYPDRVVIGTPPNQKGAESMKVLQGLYRNLNCPIINTRVASSELGKLFSNAMLAQRISSINSLTQLCEIEGACIQDLSRIVGSDKRIGPAFLQCSPGFGGSCFEKDLQSLIYILESNG